MFAFTLALNTSLRRVHRNQGMMPDCFFFKHTVCALCVLNAEFSVIAERCDY